MTVGPLQPGLGCAATPTGLTTTTMSVVVVHDLHAFDGLGHDLYGRGRRGQLHFEPCPAVHPVRLAGRGPVQQHLSVGGQFGRLGAREAEYPGDGGVDALALQSVRYGQGTGLGKGAHPSSMPDARTRSFIALCDGARGRRPLRSLPVHCPVRVQAAEGEDHDQDAAAHDRRIREVEDREVRRRDEVDDSALEDTGRAEDAVREIPERTAQQQPEGHGPGRAAQLPRDPGDDDDHDGRDRRQYESRA